MAVEFRILRVPSSFLFIDFSFLQRVDLGSDL